MVSRAFALRWRNNLGGYRSIPRGLKMTVMCADGCAVWEATQRLGLYGLNDAELETLIQHAGGPQPDARLAAEAARYVRDLRLGLANAAPSGRAVCRERAV
jgi:hypothetical protein